MIKLSIEGEKHQFAHVVQMNKVYQRLNFLQRAAGLFLSYSYSYTHKKLHE